MAIAAECDAFDCVAVDSSTDYIAVLLGRRLRRYLSKRDRQQKLQARRKHANHELHALGLSSQSTFTINQRPCHLASCK